MLKSIYRYSKKFLRYIQHKVRWGSKCQFTFSVNIDPASSFEAMSKLYPHVTFRGKLGYGSYIGSRSFLSADIGRFTSIAPNVRCNAGRHTYTTPFATTSPCFFSLMKQNSGTFATEQLFDEFSYYDVDRKIAIKIGSDCWIGENVFIVGGVKIGDGAVVLANAVVTKNIPDYAIVGGVPAKVIRYRYDGETITFLQTIRWWDNQPDWFRKNWRLLTNVEELKKFYHDNN